MKKRLIILFLFFFLFGCSHSSADITAAANTAYEGYYKAIEDNTRFETSSLYYSLSGQIVEQPDHTYRYYVILDEAQIAMYDVTVLAVENELPYSEAEKMMPNIGIFDSVDFNMIPFQSFASEGYVKGIVISGESNDPSLSLKILVEWTDKTHENYRRQFFSLMMDTEHGLFDPDSLIQEDNMEDEEDE